MGGSQPEPPKAPAVAAPQAVQSNAAVKDTVSAGVNLSGRPQQRVRDDRRTGVPGLGL